MDVQATVLGGDIDLPRFLGDLREWVELETPSGDGVRIGALTDTVERRAKAGGFRTERHAGRNGSGDILAVHWGFATPEGSRGDDRILVLAHLDTVHPAGTLADRMPWRRDGDRIGGPGVYDMKSGALMALVALEHAAAAGAAGRLPVTILFTADEESGSHNSRDLIERTARHAKYALVVEPARNGGKIVTARKGIAACEIVVRGRAAHAGVNPQDGRSAIVEAARIVLALGALNDPDRGIDVTVGTIRGGARRNIVPEECHLAVDIRVPTADAAREILQALDRLAPTGPDIALHTTARLNRPPFARTPQAMRLFEHARALAAPLGLDLDGIATGGGSDGNFTAALGVATLDGLGADGAGAHTTDEHILASSVPPRTALLANMMLTLA